MNPSLIDELRRVLEEPEPLDVLAAGREKLGAYRHWTFERQTWYLRRSAMLTQAELAERSGVGQHRISEIEAGADLKLSTLTRLWGGMGWRPLIIPEYLIAAKEPRP